MVVLTTTCQRKSASSPKAIKQTYQGRFCYQGSGSSDDVVMVMMVMVVMVVVVVVMVMLVMLVMLVMMMVAAVMC